MTAREFSSTPACAGVGRKFREFPPAPCITRACSQSTTTSTLTTGVVVSESPQAITTLEMRVSLLFFLGSVLSLNVPSPCRLLSKEETCANSTGCAWCQAPTIGGSCYNPTTESCCTTSGLGCTDVVSICDASTEKCAFPYCKQCDYLNAICIPVNSTVCTNMAGVTGCLPDKPQCCDPWSDDHCALFPWCCAASQTCGTSTGECT
jgi:hypothetical protein